MDVLGYFGAVIIGLCLGLIGGGGSILAVPVLAYLFTFDEKIATAYSLFVVGIAALFGGVKQHLEKHVHWKTAFIFGAPAILGVWLVRHYIVPILPDVLFVIGNFEFTRRMAMFGLFAILMILAAYSMLNDQEKEGGTGIIKYNLPVIFLEGFIVGGVTGFVGAGGGFLIIPALVLFANLDIKMAIGTSLIIIAIKSLLGFFLGDALTMQIDWQFLGLFTTMALVGILIGTFISRFANGQLLKKVFSYFIIVMACFIFLMEFVIV